MDTQKNILVSGHRGYAARFPENTLVSFEAALKLPLDMLEFDLHMTRDGEIIMMHDHKVDRTTDGTGLIRSFSLAEIKKLDAGKRKGEQFAGTRIPTFIEFLEVLKHRPDIGLCVELKDYPKDDAEWAWVSADKSLALIEKYGMADRCVINSWSAELLEYVDEKYDHRYKLHGYYPLDLMGERTRDPYEYLYCICLFGPKEAPVAPKAAFDYAGSRNVQPWVYYPDDSLASYDGAIENGAMLITANDPDKALTYLREKGLHR
jgi:glycerophosphoryl diester phosphodiesterase